MKCSNVANYMWNKRSYRASQIFLIGGIRFRTYIILIILFKDPLSILSSIGQPRKMGRFDIKLLRVEFNRANMYS